MTAPHASHIFKIITAPLWADAQSNGTVPGMPIDDADGYMHFSTKEQLNETLSLHFKGQSDLYILKVATDSVSQDLKWEPSRGGALFPHLYGQLPIAKIEDVFTAHVTEDGVPNITDLI